MRRSVSVLILAVALAGSACGDPAQSLPTTAVTAAPSATTAPAGGVALEPPVEVTSEAGPVVLEAPAERIAALSAAHVEMLFAMGAGDRVIAGDLFSDYPPETDRLVRLDSFNLSVEAVIDLDPDLVVLTFDPGDAVAALESVGIPALLFAPPRSLEAAYDQVRALGAASGHSVEAAELVDRIDAGVAALVASTGDRAEGLTYYHETDPFSYFTPNSASFIGEIYALLGMENIADAAQDEFGSGYPQLSPEFIIESDPDVIFLGSEGETRDSVAARDAWSTMSAVSAGRVFELDADESSRWGPRIVDFLEDVVAAINTLPEDI